MSDEPQLKPVADHFSGVSNSYAAFRPSYPEALFDALADMAPSHALAWDSGAGTGQATLALTQRFASVLATDSSASQIGQATPHPRVTYRVAPAHDSELPDGSVGLITVAQALHWFDVDAFHAEAQRVLVPHGIIAEWTYALAEVPSSSALTELIASLDATVGTWWPPEREHVNNGYSALEFPFTRVEPGNFCMEADWSPEQLLGYLSTWSAITHMRNETGVDPLVEFAAGLDRWWGRVPLHRFKWPLSLRVGRHEKGAPPPVQLPPQPPQQQA
ncbi:MAG TPA: class I SAM-dependent methyltransferase [Gemmatimonas sp.]|nr:class I SAM-dependent methyltransferase [Gemmatimonas sp.]